MRKVSSTHCAMSLRTVQVNCHVTRTRQMSGSRDVGDGAYSGNGAVKLCYIKCRKDHGCHGFGSCALSQHAHSRIHDLSIGCALSITVDCIDCMMVDGGNDV